MGYRRGAFMRARTIFPSGKGTVSSAQKQASFAKNLKYFFNSVFNNFSTSLEMTKGDARNDKRERSV